jgi:NAD(P)-dependent dehydrogenase (short-subunit alcohol dehydrogenase family)
MGLLDGKVAIVTGSGNGVGRGEAIMLADHGAKVVVNDLGGSVTGGSRGLGHEMVKAFAACGADVIIASRKLEPCEAVAEEVRAMGRRALPVACHVGQWEAIPALVEAAYDTFGKVDVLVNNAGILRDRMIFSMTEDEFDSVIRVHLKGTWNTMHHASVYWRNESKEGRQPRASIVNTVSSAGLQGQASQTNYGAAKAGIAALTIIASLELSRYGVRANCIGPGGFTRMVGVAMQDAVIRNPEEYETFDGMNPGNSAPGVVWLASDDSIPVTGQVLRVVGNNLAVYKPWELGEQFLSKDKDGNPTQWDPAEIGPTLHKYVFNTINPGIARIQRG